MTAPALLRGRTIGFLGAGTMGQALIRGLLASGVPRARLQAAEPNSAIRRLVARRFGVRVSPDNVRVARTADILILAVKPQQVPAVLDELAPRIRRRQLVISIAAGVRLPRLETRLPGVPVVRVMPNLPATVGQGFAAIAAGRAAAAHHRALARAIFASVGEVAELPERHFDAVTAVSGSGPAYVFFLAHAWERAASALGLPAAVARRAVRATLSGSAALLEASPEPPDALIAQVASKRGTTEAALAVLARRRVRASIEEALGAAARRSRQLSRR